MLTTRLLRGQRKGIIITAAIGNAGASSSDTSFDLHTNNALGAVDTATTVGVARLPQLSGLVRREIPILFNENLC